MAHRNEHTIEIDRPAATIFPWLVEADKRVRWVEKLVASSPLEEGEAGVGSTWREVFHDRGQRFEVESELAAYEPYEAVDVRMTSKGFTATVSSRLAEHDGRTTVTTAIESDYAMLVAKLFAPIVTRHAQRQLEADLATLKRLVESGT